jgi:hypothetical protein
MWVATVWAWLKDEGNQKALALIGGFVAFLWSAGWAVFVYIHPPPDPKHADKNEGPVPAHERPRKPSPSVPRSWSFLSVLSAPAFKIWGAGIALAMAGYLGWLAYFYQPTVITAFRVCRGEFKNLCEPHDVFVGCGDPNVWASNACLKYTATQIGTSRDGNQCGYNVWRFSCSQKTPR